MRIFQLARTPPHWLRACLVGLLLVLALDSVAHARHTHDQDFKTRPGVDSALCGFCVAFDRMVDSPVAPVLVHAPAERSVHELRPATAAPSIRLTLRFVPRGPPAV